MSSSVGPYGPGSKYNEAEDRSSLNDGLWRAGSGKHAYTPARLKYYGCPELCWPYLDEVVEIKGGFVCSTGGMCGFSHPKILLTGNATHSTVTFEGIKRGTRVPQWPILLRLSGFCGRAMREGAHAPFGVAEAVQRLSDSGVPDIHLRVRGDHTEALRMRREIEQNCAHEHADKQGETVCEDCGGLVGSFMGEEDDAFLDSVNASGCSCGSSGDLVADALGSADAANTTAAAAEPSVPSEARAAKRQRQQRQAEEDSEEEEEDSEEEEEDSDAEEIHRSLARAKQRAKARGEEW